MSEFNYAKKQAFQRRFMKSLLGDFPEANRYVLFALLIMFLDKGRFHFFDTRSLLAATFPDSDQQDYSENEIRSLIPRLSAYVFEDIPLCDADLNVSKAFDEYRQYLMDLFDEQSSEPLPVLRKPPRWKGNKSFLGTRLITNISTEAEEIMVDNFKLTQSLNILNRVGYKLNADIAKLDNLDFELGKYKSRIGRLDSFDKNKETDTFYFLHSYDRRGRMISKQYFGISPQADNFSKALLQYSDSRPLGATGLKAMFLALAEATMPKVNGASSYDEKLKFAKTTGLEIAFKAQECEGDWEKIKLQTGLSFTAYAISMDILRAKASGNPETYESNIIIFQDATSSGFQIAAALTKDEELAALTNLTSSASSSRPQDLYLRFTDNLIKNDRVQALSDIADRDFGKLVFMPAGYGAGAKRLTEEIYDEYDLDNKLFDSIKFAIDEAIQQTAGSLHKLTKALQQSVAEEKMLFWKTADGFTAVHEPRSSEHRQTRLGRKSKRHPKGAYCYTEPLTKGEIDPICVGSDFYGGISPNFIHSIDGAIARAIINSAEDVGFNITSIHDSFGTHACYVEILNLKIRRAFKDTMEYDWLTAFSQANETPAIDIEKGAFELSEVLHSTYMFTID